MCNSGVEGGERGRGVEGRRVEGGERGGGGEGRRGGGRGEEGGGGEECWLDISVSIHV